MENIKNMQKGKQRSPQAQELRAIRDSLGWSQPEMAGKLGISPGTLVFYENDHRRVPEHRLIHARRIAAEILPPSAQSQTRIARIGRQWCATCGPPS